jgi:uncharacterized protein YnzC (UPF0291/DUF896 family)
MDRKSMDRISELSRKQRSVGLTQEEEKEQKCLREKYLADVRKNLKQTLDNITIVEKEQ